MGTILILHYYYYDFKMVVRRGFLSCHHPLKSGKFTTISVYQAVPGVLLATFGMTGCQWCQSGFRMPWPASSWWLPDHKHGHSMGPLDAMAMGRHSDAGIGAGWCGDLLCGTHTTLQGQERFLQGLPLHPWGYQDVVPLHFCEEPNLSYGHTTFGWFHLQTADSGEFGAVQSPSKDFMDIHMINIVGWCGACVKWVRFKDMAWETWDTSTLRLMMDG